MIISNVFASLRTYLEVTKTTGTAKAWGSNLTRPVLFSNRKFYCFDLKILSSLKYF